MLIINTTAGKLTFIRKPKSFNANRISSNFTTKPSYKVFISPSFNPSVFVLTRMDGAPQVCPDHPGRGGRRGCLTHHMHNLTEHPWILTNESTSWVWAANKRRVLTCLGGGAGDGRPPPEQDAGWAAGQHGVTLSDGVTQILTFRPLRDN